MSERNDSHELAIAHGGLFVDVNNLMASKTEAVKTIWGPEGFMQVLGGFALRNGDSTSAETLQEEVALAYGYIGRLAICDVHFFRNTPHKGSEVARIVSDRFSSVFASPLTRLSLPIQHTPEQKLDITRVQLLRERLDATEYDAEESKVAARVLLQHGVYTEYTLEDVSFGASGVS